MASNDQVTTTTSKKKFKKKNLLGPLLSCTFGPKARTDSIVDRLYTIGAENQKLSWTKPPENVLIIKRIGNETNECFKLMSRWLIEEKKLNVYVEPKVLSDSSIKHDPKFKKVLELLRKRVFKSTQAGLAESIDLIITIGGDGTLLYAASLFQSSMPPVIAFSAGSLGFLTAHYPTNYKEDIEHVLAGNATLMLRSRLWCKIQRYDNKFYKKMVHFS